MDVVKSTFDKTTDVSYGPLGIHLREIDVGKSDAVHSAPKKSIT